MGKKRPSGSGAPLAGGALPNLPSSSLWFYSAGECQLSRCPLEFSGIRQVSCSLRHVAVVLSDGRVALCATQEAGALPTGKPKYFSLGKLKVTAVDCGLSNMLLLSADGKLHEHDYVASISPFHPIKRLHDRRIIQVACGDHHCMALSKGGELFTWGENTHGQLGLRSQPSRQSTPQLVEHLMGSPLAQITAGSAHSIALSLTGTVYSWGNNTAGQLGLGHMDTQYLPTLVEALWNKGVEFVACGAEHTAVLSKDGLVYTFGAGEHGQLGHKYAKHEPLPRLVVELHEVHVTQVACGRHHTLAYATSSKTVYLFGVEEQQQRSNGDIHGRFMALPMQLPELDNHGKKGTSGRTYKIIAGGNQSAVVLLEEKFCDRGMNRQIAKVEPGMPERWLADGNSDQRRRTKQEKDCKTSDISWIDLKAASHFFDMIANREQVLQQISSCLKNYIIPELSQLPAHRDALAIFLLLPECSLMHGSQESLPLVAAFATAVNNLKPTSLKILEKLWSSLSASSLSKHVLMLTKVIVSPLNSTYMTLQDYEIVNQILETLKKLYKVNMKANIGLPVEEFYIHELCDSQFLCDDVRAWHTLKQENVDDSCMPLLCIQFPFLLNLLAKRQVLQIDLALKQKVEVLSLLMNCMEESSQVPGFPFFFLTVRNTNILEDTLDVLSTAKDCDLRKALTVEIIGMSSFDQDALKRILFNHVFEDMLNPEYGMFVQCGQFSPLWFPANPSFEPKTYFLFGILCGLTIFNCASIYLPFPLALFSKLLDQQPTLADLKELDPVRGRSLQELLDYEYEDIVDNYEVCYIATWDSHTVDLIPNGSDTSVDNSNKHDFVNKYVDYVFNKSVEVVFEQFKRGFYKVCEKELLKEFHPKELRSIIIGNEEYDWKKLEQNAEYAGVYEQQPPHPTINIFWEVFHELPLSEKKKFLLFLVGSDCVPVFGMDFLKITIMSSPSFTEDHLPYAQTCFLTLKLPPYSKKEVLKEKLLLAICHNRGFHEEDQ
ncbi:E3 ISG15--protein ligase HERC5-like isoform X2 [Lissotriton helveticus]